MATGFPISQSRVAAVSGGSRALAAAHFPLT
jgi:hypothetical protein